MKITRIDVYQKTLHLSDAIYSWSKGRSVEALDATFVKLTTDDGLSGFGECTPLGPAYMPSYAEGVRAGLRVLGPHMIGLDPREPKAVNLVMDSVMAGHEYAKTPIDIACWDLLGKAAGLPISTLLGARYVEEFPVYRALSQGSAEEMVASAAKFRAQGIRHFQMKVGGEADEDIARIRAVLDFAKREKPSWPTPTRDGLFTRLRGSSTRFAGEKLYIEQPCATLAECLSIRARTDLPMVLDEIITSIPIFVDAYSRGALDVLNAKVSRWGGITKTAQIRDLAQALGVALDLEDAASSDVMSAAMAHLAGSTRPEAFFTASIWNYRLRESVSPDSPKPVNGRVSVPRGPGLGITVDEEALGAPVFTVV